MSPECKSFTRSVQVETMKWQIWFLIFFTVLFKVTHGLYFPKSLYTFHIPGDVQTRTTIGHVYVLNNVTSLCDVSNITYMLYWPPDYSDKGSPLVEIGHVTGEVNVTRSEDTGHVNTTLELSVNASCSDRLGQLEVAFVRVRIQVTRVKRQKPGYQHDSKNNNWFEKFCWREEDQIYIIQEDAAPLTFGDLRDMKVEHLTTSYSVDEESTPIITINNMTSEMTLTTPLDREDKTTVTVNVTCTVYNMSREVHKARRTVRINLIDVNDNPPVFFRNFISPQLTVINVTKDGQIPKIMLKDADSGTKDQYEITVPDDPYDLLDTPGLQVFNPGRGYTYIIPRVDVTLRKGARSHVVDISIRDKGFQAKFNTQNLTDTATLRLYFYGKVPAVKTNLTRGATKFSRVITLSNTDALGNCSRFSLSPSVTSPFAVTPVEGIMYVKDEKLLQKVSDVLDLLLGCQREKGLFVHVSIQVQLVGVIGQKQTSCDGSCARFMDSQSCMSGCGIGSQTRECSWRPGLSGMNKFYETCTMDTLTCPNSVCDELEQLSSYICPQDCTTGKIIGAGQINSQTHRGISIAKGPCWCDEQCQCMVDGQRLAKTNRETLPPSTEGVTNVANTVAAAQRADDMEKCGSTCKVTVALTIVFVSTVSIISIIACWYWRRRRTRRSQILKHVGSNVSMTALPSDYLEDREPRTSYHTNPSPQWSPKVTLPSLRTNLHVDKWEFPREHLHLEQTLGEGEFGQVVQAKALGINGDDKYATVAVKMLKPDASGSEYQDLWSELNLLKEVNHPNVIRLLGACTHNGPFYVIVEFCKYGSLKQYLRGARFKDRKSWDEKQDSVSGESDRIEPTRVLVLRDLLSFAWQIAKGMGYLSNMKFVHRDLAARNVLVSDGRVLKISDFGLSRDVYEADAYLKLTKGRIPVKWMAPESLYAQIYTTKSDIWSFGILLWEIITLGANPYPGIAPERLFSLLRTGYRMDRPEDCPEEVYAIMQKCWKSEPEERPHFSKLSDLLDTMLQQREGYLDLTDNTAYMEERLNYLDSTDLRGEWSDDEEGYGSITVLRQGGDNYLTALPESEADLEEGEGEKGKLLPPSPKMKECVKEWDSNKLPKAECGEDVWLLKDRTISNLSKGKTWRDNAYEIHCV